MIASFGFTNRARRIVALARQEAYQLNHAFITDVHLLHASCNIGEATGARILSDFCNVKFEIFVPELMRRLLDMGTEAERRTPACDGSAKQAIKCAIEEARYYGHNYAGSEHLLLGILRAPSHSVEELLKRNAVTLERVREVAELLLEPGRTVPLTSLSEMDKLPDSVRAVCEEKFGPDAIMKAMGNVVLGCCLRIPQETRTRENLKRELDQLVEEALRGSEVLGLIRGN